jgi:protein-disulfide isomerase
MTEKKNRRVERARQRERKQLLQKLVIATLLIVAVAAGVVMMINSKSTTKDSAELYKNQPMIGQADAPVKMVEVGDFKCPACKRFTINEYPQIKKELIDTGIASFYFVNFPFLGSDSTTAALAVESVFAQKPAAFWDYYKAIYDAQGDERTNWATPDKLIEIAEQTKIAVDVNRLRQDIEKETHMQQVEDDLALAKKYRVTSTPTLLVNGEKIKFENFADIKQAVLKARDEQKAKDEAKK